MASYAVAAAPAVTDERAAPAQLAERALQIGYRAALGVLGSREAAEDVAQEVAIKALLHGRKLRDPARADAWLYRVATRTALKEIRRARGRSEAERAAPPPREDEPLGDLLALLDGLPPRQRAVLTLRYAFDLSDHDIAAAIGCREATVRAHLHHGRAALRARLDPEGTR